MCINVSNFGTLWKFAAVNTTILVACTGGKTLWNTHNAHHIVSPSKSYVKVMNPLHTPGSNWGSSFQAQKLQKLQQKFTIELQILSGSLCLKGQATGR